MAKFNWQKTTIVILGILLLVSIVYIVYFNYSLMQAQKQYAIAQSAYQQGYQQAITEIITQADKCNAVPLYIGNKTTNVVSMSCLQKAPSAQS